MKERAGADNQSKRLKKNVIFNIYGSVPPVLAGLISVPYLLRQLSGQEFGILTLIWALIGYFSLFDLGIGRALTYQLSNKNNESPSSKVQIISTGLALSLVVGITSSIVIFLTANNGLLQFLGVTQDMLKDATLSFKIASTGVFITTLNSSVRGCLEGLNMFAYSNQNKAVIGVTTFMAPMLTVYMGYESISASVFAIVIARAMILVYSIIPLHGYLSLSLSVINKYAALGIIRYGGWITVTGIIGPIMVYCDRFFVSAIVGAQILAFYSIPQEGLQRLLIIPSSICNAVFPEVTKSNATELPKKYISYLLRMIILMLPLCVLGAFIGYALITVFISTSFATKTIFVLIILSFGILFNGVASVPYTFLHALGLPRVTACFHAIQLALYLVLVWLLTSRWLLEGAAIAWTIRALADLVMLHIFTVRYLRPLSLSNPTATNA
jgi:O-antigen/teichoic acid export membrane protein